MKFIPFLVLLLCSLSSLAQYEEFNFTSVGTSGKNVIKTSKYEYGYIVFKDGKSMQGDIQLKTINNEAVELRYKDAAKNKTKYLIKLVDYFGLGLKPDKKSVKTPAAANNIIEIVNTHKFPFLPEKITEITALSDEGNISMYDSSIKPNNNPLKNLQPGYALLNDGRKFVGQIAQFKREFVFVDANNKTKTFDLEGLGLNHLVQEIDGNPKTFTAMRQGVQAISASDPGMVFSEVFGYDQNFSYYQNPKPTHKRKGATNLGNAAGAAASQKHAGGVVEFGQDEDEGAFFEEFIILNNQTKQQWIVYKKNDKELMTQLLKPCENFSTIDQNQLKSLTDVKRLDEFIQYLNSNGCN